jgi:hypothetical protein
MATMHGIGESAGISVAEAIFWKMDFSLIDREGMRSRIPYMSGAPAFGYPWELGARSIQKIHYTEPSITL